MNRDEFVKLRRLRDKEIAHDISFSPAKKSRPNLLVFEGAKVSTSTGHEIVLNGSYDHRTRATIFNFVLQGVGPICRVEANSTVHQDVGRTHKQELQNETDPRKNLPFADTRTDLENKTPLEIWQILCTQASINHTGKFYDPSGRKK